MMNRRFNSQRAYKIIKIIVIIVTLVFLIKGYYDWNGWNNWPQVQNDLITNDCYRNGQKINNFQGCEADIFNAVMEVSSSHGKGLKEDITILVLLWGGIGLHKYLFSVKKNKD